MFAHAAMNIRESARRILVNRQITVILSKFPSSDLALSRRVSLTQEIGRLLAVVLTALFLFVICGHLCGWIFLVSSESITAATMTGSEGESSEPNL